mmetsp:Transcript_29005/g.61552  ORF Transcript_29005/g.61552 Transcript_29005/m.61552 type:complete len:287 (-) Transcript_29005:915-1775(-)
MCNLPRCNCTVVITLQSAVCNQINTVVNGTLRLLQVAPGVSSFSMKVLHHELRHFGMHHYLAHRPVRPLPLQPCNELLGLPPLRRIFGDIFRFRIRAAVSHCAITPRRIRRRRSALQAAGVREVGLQVGAESGQVRHRRGVHDVPQRHVPLPDRDRLVRRPTAGIPHLVLQLEPGRVFVQEGGYRRRSRGDVRPIRGSRPHVVTSPQIRQQVRIPFVHQAQQNPDLSFQFRLVDGRAFLSNRKGFRSGFFLLRLRAGCGPVIVAGGIHSRPSTPPQRAQQVALEER